MANLRKLTLTYNEKKDNWALKDDFTNRTVERFDTKQDATKEGALRKALGPEVQVNATPEVENYAQFVSQI